MIWSARARALVSGRCTVELVKRVRGAQRGVGRVVPLVAGGPARPRPRLFLGVGGEHPEADGEPVGPRPVREAAGARGVPWISATGQCVRKWPSLSRLTSR